MKEIDKKDTAILLAALDRNIDIKCIELKEKQRERKLKKIFFASCLLMMTFFIIQILFKVFNLNFLVIFLIYQVLALALLTPFVININKGGEYRWE